MPAARTSQHLIGVDVGGTKIAVGIVKFPGGRVIAHRVIPTEAHRGGAAVLDRLVAVLQELTASAKVKPVGLGIGLCELVSPDGKINSHATLNWSSQQVRRKLKGFGPVTIEADVRAAALAEAMFGAARKYRNFLFVTVGTGISCCLIIDGKPYLGTRGATGTMASATLSQRCEQCGHIQKLSVEDVASGRGLVARFKRVGGEALRTEDVVESDSYAAMEVLGEGGEALGNTIALLVDVLDPEAVIVGGGLGLTNGIYWKSAVAYARQNIWSEVSRGVPIRHAKLGREGGIIGAAVSAWTRHKGKA